MITNECVLYPRSFLLILLYALLFDVQKSQRNILMQRNTFLAGDMNFNRVYTEVSKDIPFILVFETVMWWTSIFVDVLLFADKYTFSFSFFMSSLAFRHAVWRFSTAILLRKFLCAHSKEIVEYWEGVNWTFLSNELPSSSSQAHRNCRFDWKFLTQYHISEASCLLAPSFVVFVTVSSSVWVAKGIKILN